jgi:protein-disulfide isomerase
MEKMTQFMNSEKAKVIIKQDLEDAKTLGANKTPSYFVNGKPLQEFGLENLKKLIKSEL